MCGGWVARRRLWGGVLQHVPTRETTPRHREYDTASTQKHTPVTKKQEIMKRKPPKKKQHIK